MIKRRIKSKLNSKNGLNWNKIRSSRTTSVCFGYSFSEKVSWVILKYLVLYSGIFFVWYLIPTSRYRVKCSLVALLKLLYNFPDKICVTERPLKFKAILWFTQRWLFWKIFDDSNNSNKVSPKQWLQNYSK